MERRRRCGIELARENQERHIARDRLILARRRSRVKTRRLTEAERDRRLIDTSELRIGVKVGGHLARILERDLLIAPDADPHQPGIARP
jgi:hypothetical protein